VNPARATHRSRTEEVSPDFEAALADISAGAAGRDADPAFPRSAFERLAAAGALGLNVPGPDSRPSFTWELAAVRAVSRADASVGRIYDGHLNAVERLAVAAPEPLRSRELERVSAGELLLGVWGADPIPGEGEPARLVETAAGHRLSGVKTFCSGAGGLDAALVAARGESGEGPPYLVYVDLGSGVEVDRLWYRGAGMRASESHRVVFREARVLAVLGERGELTREPYFSRDGIRTAATWAGVADAAVEAALETLAAKSGGEPDQIVSLAAGKMLAAQATVDRWLEGAGSESLVPDGAFSIRLRSEVAEACRAVLDEAARACGSRPFAVADALDRARRDLEIFLLQHRLEPALARYGRREIQERAQ
jgi:alkylation response protein AidB-like acyl-CoA dehydrogenase